VGDWLYGAPRETTASGQRGRGKKNPAPNAAGRISLPRNFLHAAQLEFLHPRTGKKIALQSPLPRELSDFLETLGGPPYARDFEPRSIM
jgi:23S rRNA pseudouridine1911/1915/1917 synthase